MAYDFKSIRARTETEPASLSMPQLDQGPVASNSSLLEGLTVPTPEAGFLTPETNSEAFESFDIGGRKGGLGVGQFGGARSKGG